MLTVSALVLRVVEFLVRERMTAAAPVVGGDFFFDIFSQFPEVPVVLAEDVVCEFVAQGVADDFVISIAVVRVRAQAQLNNFASVPIQP